MRSNDFNICPSCSYLNTCVLTAHKDTVWSCSEFEEMKPLKAKNTPVKKPVPQFLHFNH